MLRGWLVIIFAMGLFVSVLNSAAPGGSSVSNFDRQRLSEAKQGAESGEPKSGDPDETGTVELERSYDGHFYADVEINGTPVHALVDTGATGIALSRDDARKAGLAVSIGMPGVIGEGADGEVRGEYVTLDRVTLGHTSVENMSAVVLSAGEQTLLGQTFLSKFESVEMKGDRMILR